MHTSSNSTHQHLSVQKFSLLGSTGSIGTQSLEIIQEHPEQFELVALGAGSNIELLADQIRQFQPSLVSLKDGSKVQQLRELIKDVQKQPDIMTGQQGAIAVAEHPDADAVITGIVGCAGLQPTCRAIEAGKDICLANKETLIAGAPYVLPLAQKHGVHILPAGMCFNADGLALFSVTGCTMAQAPIVLLLLATVNSGTAEGMLHQYSAH